MASELSVSDECPGPLHTTSRYEHTRKRASSLNPRALRTSNSYDFLLRKHSSVDQESQFNFEVSV